MQPTKPNCAGQQHEHEQHEQQQQRKQLSQRPPQQERAAKQTRSEIENQPPVAQGAAGETNLASRAATSTARAEVAARTGAHHSLASTTSVRGAPPSPPPLVVERTSARGASSFEGANEPSLSCTIELQPDYEPIKQSSEQSLKQIYPRPAAAAAAAGEQVEANKAQAGRCGSGNDDDECGSLDEPVRRRTNNARDPDGQIRFEREQRQAPSGFSDSRPDRQQRQQGRRQSNTGISGATSGSGATGTGAAVICGLVDGSSSSGSGSGSRSSSDSGPAGAPADELPVGCQKLPQPPRLFNQNSSSSSSGNVGQIPSEQARESEKVPADKNQKQQQQQQRIKVTLSKPKQELEQEEEARKLGEFYTQTQTIDQQPGGGQVRTPRRSTATLISGSSEPEVDSIEFYDSPLQQQAHGPPPEKINQIWPDSAHPPSSRDANKQAAAAQVGCPAKGLADAAGQRELELTRLERENQLRRIASQRRRTPASQSGGPTENATAAANETRRSVKAPRATAVSDEKEKRNFLLATASRAGGQQQTLSKQQGADLSASQSHDESQTGAEIVIPSAEQQTNAPIKQQLQTHAQPATHGQDLPSLPSKQLAIYINGKIRSNSIFCSRSVSSNSFTSILKSFHSAASSSSPPLPAPPPPPPPPLPLPTQSDNNGQPASYLEQRLACKPNHEPQAFLTGSHNKSQAASAKEPSEQDYPEAAGPANKSFVHCLVPSGRRDQPQDSVCGQQQTERGQQGFLARCCDYILARAKRGQQVGSKSTGIHDHDHDHDHDDDTQSQAKRLEQQVQVTTTNTSDNQQADQQQPRTYKLNPSSMFLRKAMRYYRLWIYSANLTILLGAIIFLLSTLYVVSDYRFQLIVASSSWPVAPGASSMAGFLPQSSEPLGLTHDNNSNNNKSRFGQISANNVTQQANDSDQPLQHQHHLDEQSFTISLSEPTIVLAYLMIVLQLGLLQALGCFGAIQMKERLIQAFWYLILALIITDVLILVYWLQRYDTMLRSLRDEMTNRLERQYGNINELHLLQDMPDSLAQLRNSSVTFDDFTRKNTERQQSAHVVATGSAEAEQTSGALLQEEARAQFDKIFTQIFDRIQSESQCCGVSSSLDYKHTRWREARVAQLRELYLKQERQENPNHQEENNQEQVIAQLDKLLAQLPLVPASCCRAPRSDAEAQLPANVIQQQQQQQQQQHLDDSQLPQRARVPAWSPSMVVDNLIVGYADNLGGQQQRGATTSPASQLQRRAEEEEEEEEEEDGQTNGQGEGGKQQQQQREELTLADVIDRRWSGSRSWRHSSSGRHENDGDSDHDKSRSQTGDGADNKKTTRLLAKQMHYGQGTSSAAGDGGDELEEANFSSSDDDGWPERVARQLQRRAAARQDEDEEDGPSTGNSYDSEEDAEEEEPDLGKLEGEAQDNNNNESGRRGWRKYRAENDELLSSSSESTTQASLLESTGLSGGEPTGSLSTRVSNLQEEEEEEDADESGQWAIETKLDKRGRVLARLVELATVRRADNHSTHGPHKKLPDKSLPPPPPYINNQLRLGLTRDQLQLIESYLTSDEIGQMTDEQQLHQQNEQKTYSSSSSSPADRVISRRSILSTATSNESGRDKQQQQLPLVDAAKQRIRVKQLKRLQELVARSDGAGGPSTCVPRSHYDEARIYTRGCQAHIRAWIQSSANILFVMGFCVLTVLKFCSLILLRLEIREMIHKIRVLKGMATEYNALQDLEPYLPRPSICAQAAELTSTGVASALGQSAGGEPTTQVGQSASGLSNMMGQQQQQQQQVGESGPGGPLAASCSSPTAAGSGYMGVPRRIGGSFSEAVAAATAVAHQQKLAEQQQQAQLARHLRHCERASSLANCARAASTKTILGGGCSCAVSLGPAAGTGMLTAPHTGGLCPCASSLSMTTHLSHSASQSQAATGGLSLRSDLFPPLGMAMPRRHTAVSVCPAAAAAATAAAHHLMMRRGTFALANPLTFTTTGQQQQQQQQQALCQQQQGPGILKPTSAVALSAAASSANMLQAKSLNYLNQHRHSAHAVPPSHLLFGGGGGVGGSRADASGGGGGGGGMNFLNPTNRQHQQQARRSSNLSPSEMATLATANNTNHRFNNNTHLEPGGSGDENSQQQQPVFKRQASGGAQSAVNFSLDIAPAAAGGQLGESRRSIH